MAHFDSKDPLSYMGINPEKQPETVKAKRNPSSSDTDYQLGAQWINTSTNTIFSYVANGTWETGGNVDATSTTKGIASFDANDFTVTSGAVALNEAIPNYATVTLTSAEVKALATTPIELVAAPAAGKALIFMGASLKLTYGGSNVFAEAGDNLGIKYENASGVQVSSTIESTGWIDQSASTYTSATVAQDAIVAASACEAKALVLDNLGSNFTGNAADDNTVTVSVCYRVVNI